MVIRSILKAIGIDGMAMATSCSQPLARPYKDDAAHLIYELLFCDRLDLFRDNFHGELVPPWPTIFSDEPDINALRSIAKDDSQESRVRVLAFNRLRAARQEVPTKILLGIIVEVHLPEGLDTLAVFVDGGARYINHSGKMVVVEGTSSDLGQGINAVIATAKPIVEAIGHWDKNRLPSPERGNTRMTFLVSDGLYFGEGPMDVMQKEQMAAPLINAATALLVKLVDKTTDSEQSPGHVRK